MASESKNSQCYDSEMIATTRSMRLLFAAPILFGLVSVLIGQDTNWDLRNYHWYNPYALLNGRFDLDIAPAGLQSFFSPLLDIPWFILGRALPALLIGFLLGAVHSANLILIYFISARLLPSLKVSALFLIDIRGM